MSRGRIAWVDDAKGLGVVLVLVLHSVFPEPMRAVASAFAMMLFSGFLDLSFLLSHTIRFRNL